MRILTCWSQTTYRLTTFQVKEFDRCYDGHQKWLGAKYSAHLQVAPADISRSDVVLVEASVKRRFPYDAQRRPQLDTWYVDFDIDNVVLLRSATQAKDIEPFEI